MDYDHSNTTDTFTAFYAPESAFDDTNTAEACDWGLWLRCDVRSRIDRFMDYVMARYDNLLRRLAEGPA